jgi:hypothetical protein
MRPPEDVRVVRPVDTSARSIRAVRTPPEGPLGGLTRRIRACYTPPEFASDVTPGIAGALSMSALA